MPCFCQYLLHLIDIDVIDLEVIVAANLCVVRSQMLHAHTRWTIVAGTLSQTCQSMGVTSPEHGRYHAIYGRITQRITLTSL